MNFKHLSYFELRQICYFMEVVQASNNLSEAAKNLGIKQLPLSQIIQAPEKILIIDKITKAKLF